MGKPKILPHHREDFKGYTIDELRYMRAYELARLEISKAMLLQQVNDMRKSSTMLKSGILGRLLSSFSYLEIGMMTFKAVRKIYSIFHRRRKK